MAISDLLKIMVAKEASDLFLTANAPPSIKVHGVVMPLTKNPLSPGEVAGYVKEITTKQQFASFQEHPELNFAIAEAGIGRFRVNVFQQRNAMAVVIRSIKTQIPSIEELRLPQILKELIMKKRGLFLFVGATSTGKSTSLASIIDYRNQNSDGHIITIEDPIEFLHSHKKSLVEQREVGIDTKCYQDALENTLRQAPDVILIGEIRQQETMEFAIAFSETGHLCLSTLHANNADQALDRIIHFFPESHRKQILLDLSLNLVAIISQRLIPSTDGKRVAAVEILLGTPLVQDLIRRGEIASIKDVMSKSEAMGMRTFDAALYELYKKGEITEEEALRNADSQNNLKLKIALDKGAPIDKIEGLQLQEKKEIKKGQHKPGEFISGGNDEI